MGKMDIEFPNLGIYLSNVPKSITIGNFTIALYGIVIACAFFLGLLLAVQIAKRTGQNPDTYWDLIIWLIVFTIIGARAYYVFFMWDNYKNDLLQVFNLRGGGLAIYGGIIAGVITLIVFCRKKKLNLFTAMDTCVCGLTLGQAIGRWGNFFNREVFGEYTDSLLAMRIPAEMVRAQDISTEIAAHMDGVNYIQVHPTFLYESMWNLCLLAILLIYWKHKKFVGEVTLFYFFGYGVGRAWIEAIRTDQLYITGTHIPVSMVLGIVMACASMCAEIVIRILIKNGKVPKFVTVGNGIPEKETA